MNVCQLIFLATITTILNVYVSRTQAMNLSIGHMVVPINYQITWSQSITIIILGKTSMLPTSTYPMWYDVIPPFVPLNLSLYLANPIGTK